MRLLLILLASSLSTLAAARAAVNELPEIGSPANTALTSGEEYQIGNMVMRGLRDQGQILEDPEIADYIQNVGLKIAAQAQEGGQAFQFFVVRDPRINAFALPGGFIGVNYGLVLATNNESQLAGVLAHEIAHVTQRHIARSIRAEGRNNLASAAAILAAVLIGAATGAGGDAMTGAIAVAQGAAAQAKINFTRANEYEADRVGISFLSAAGFDPNAMPDFFETMGRRAGLSQSQVPEFLQTHPVSSNRIAESRDRATQYPRTREPESESYRFVRERMRVIGATNDSDLRPYYEGRRQGRDLSAAEQYGEALAHIRAGRAADASETLRALAKSSPNLPLLHSSLGQAELAAGRPSESLRVLQDALDVSPRNVPLSIRYAEVLMQTGRSKEAHLLLLDLFNNIVPTPEQIRLTALAASGAGDVADAYYYMSEYQIANGDLMLATQQLELALAAPSLTAVQRARFAARLREIRDFLAANPRKGSARNRSDDQ